MRSALLAVALALGLGLATTGAQAATVGGNVAVMKTVADAGNSGIVEKAYYRRHWRSSPLGPPSLGPPLGLSPLSRLGIGVITTATIVTGATTAAGAKRHRCQ